MSDLRRRLVDEVFGEALDVETGLRDAFVRERCGGDAAMAAEVDELLRLAGRQAPGLEPGLAPARLLPAALADAARDRDCLREGDRVGSWRVLREVGRGGMGAVYLVERADERFRQLGALKLGRSTASGEIAWRLERERRILAALNHPGIARLLDGGQTEDGRPFLVMEYVDGRPIDRYCDEERLSLDARIRLFAEVAAAVHDAHRHLVVHRDIKPSNIIVTADGHARLLDFGIARPLTSPDEEDGQPLTRPMSRVLTPEYASPEQVSGGPVAIASDVYQLGLLLYELVTGHRAQSVTADTPAALERAVCQTAPIRPSLRVAHSAEAAAARRLTPRGLARALKGDLETIVLCALRKQADRRYGSAADLIEDLRRFEGGRPLRARPDSLSYRAGRFVARHRAAVGWTAAAAVAALLLVPSWARQRAAAAREAERARQVEQLIEHLFAFPHPRVRAEPPAAVRYIDHAAGLVRTELGNLPDSQRRLLTLLGRVYNALGHYGPSIAVLEQALALGHERFGPDSLEAAETLEWLGQSQHYLGRYQDAEASVQRALEIRRRRLGEHAALTVRTAIELGDLQHTRGDLPAAERTLRSALASLRSQPLLPRGDEMGHDSLPRAARDLANVLRDRGRHAESETLYVEAIARFRSLHGEPNQQVATSEAYFAELLIARARFDQADGLLTRSIALLRRIYDGDHALVGIALRSMGYLRLEQGRLDEAAAVLAEAQQVQRRFLGEGHAMLARAAVLQAEVARRAGRLRESRALAESALDRFDRLQLGRHPAAISARQTLAEALLARGERERARDVLAEALALARSQFVEGDARLAGLRAALDRAAPGETRQAARIGAGR